MKAIIMAGGEGKRLRSITGAMPKPLVPLLGRPMMEHILLLLKKHGITEICAAVRYRSEEIVKAFGDGHELGVSLQYRVEDEPLGTAGGVKNCADFTGGEDFLVISGDAACDFDLCRLIDGHRESGAAVTLALYKESEPLRYGLAVTDGEGYIRSFIEKPGWERVVTDLVNTGIYVVSPRAMEQVPEGRSFDFAADLFPLLLGKGEKLLGTVMDGYWCDVGTPLSYYRCCVDALEGRLRLSIPESFIYESRREIREDYDGEGIYCRCSDRAALMGALSELFMELDADYSDGIRLCGKDYSLHIAPAVSRSAVRISVDAEDAEFARELALSAKAVAEALNL